MVSVARFLLALGLFFVGGVAVGEAAVEFSSTAAFDIGQSPMDVAVSTDGDWVYVLTKAGDILIYTADGRLADTIHVGGDASFLAAGPSENQLLVGSTKGKTLQTISLEFIQEIDISGAPVMGAPDAPVVITVFMDYQCPYCVRMKPVLDQVLAQNPQHVRIAYKQFPLKMHEAALSAAAAALVANREGKFQELHALMEDDYKNLNDENILDKAVSLGFDRDTFQQKMADTKVLEQIQKDIADGKQAGVSGIPSVFINGRRLKNRSLAGFQELIDRELERGGL